MRFITITLLLILSITNVAGQTGAISGRVFDELNNEPIPFANIIIENSDLGSVTDDQGNYTITNLKPGTYNLYASFIGFKRELKQEILVFASKTTTIDFALIKDEALLDEVVLQTSPFKRQTSSPVSKNRISASEIYRNPGGNRDISKVVQVLPGVATTISFRNDIIVRGGAPNENRFFLDGIEVPNINHFATQGASGGPVGMINVNLIKNVDFYAGAFPANRGNTMSSVMEFEQISGNKDKLSGTFNIGSSDIGITLDGPTGENSSFIFSARRSYLQFLFEALKLPFSPTYNDFQYKHDFKIDDKNELTILGLAAIDEFVLNEDVNDGVTDEDDINRNNYILANIPINNQWNYTIGANWKHYSKNSNQSFIISRNHLNNEAIKYLDNLEDPNNLLLDYNSQEIENKLRFEHNFRSNGWKWNVGTGIEFIKYTNATFQKTEINGSVETIDFNSELNFSKYALFAQTTKSFLDDRLALTFGIRTDFNSYSDDMSNPLEQISPRLSASYAFNPKWVLGFNVGRYYQLPAYTVMGFRDNNGFLVNKENDISHISSDHVVTGIEFKPTNYSKISLEGFYKKYSDYPFLLNDEISLANLGGDFGVIGNEPANSTSKGRSYGVELLLQQKLSSTVYGLISYTWVTSEFQDKNNIYVPSSWDNGHILNIVAGKKLAKNWEIGAKFRLLGGAPYTPFDIELSSQKEIWDVTQRGINDWDLLNSERTGLLHQMDVRVDKKWYFNKWWLNAYLDIQNIYNSETDVPPYLDVRRDSQGSPIENPNNPNAYDTYLIDDSSGNVLPSIGIMVGF
ncbi:TonB-dependent receptor [Urechidicola vernalis]|uniref:TonB-dependent receptor n=1 Tax=Urechidicola vernalis TaxID=3075600 RepID=A0ABU2Y552_9FLAO|nr:TonB-dependent receptor [Urechidicola sp. P050]MDT0552400.1 TonB-dependent receptor [Urechidicola sp. P050]